ncbi:(E2-independent) E3 ubiquitin-conjugating enzyme FATS isoform X1 [Hippoglossus hippoglossus]|uniref:(E2-independent) E3 ubiquitin-conjugating enzyme FATS isoform X1 n=1 Tax=Hippoglossus hippoglossus TaxID=8267 RepID=UPI00148D4B20|nr:(E2-independent) E3 ubiquitin-conjugating enzyme FATS isoform X1 [Hippoglossus hippoglossus]
MSLRRPAANLRRAPGWRKSGDESCWESLISEGEYLAHVSRPPCTRRRPQSAIEGRQLDGWLEHLQMMQSDPLRAPVHDHVPVFNARTTSMATLDREQAGRTWRPRGTPSYSRASSSCGSPSLCESSLGSQESLRTGVFPSPERRGSCERVHIMQAPRKEQAQLSYVAPVKIGWLPIQRRVMMVADACQNQNQLLDPAAGQLKLKQAITPTFQKNRTSPKVQDGEVEGTHAGTSPLGVKTSQQTADQGSRVNKQVPEKQGRPPNEGSRPLGWQALRRGWNTVRASAFPGYSRSIELPSGTSSDPNGKSPPMKTTSVQPLKYSPLHRTTSSEPCRPQTLTQGTNSAETYKPHTSSHRTNSVQPIRATAPLLRSNSSSQPAHIQTSSAVTTLIPQNKAGFSSITISSRKVSRSSSLPSSSRSSLSGSPPPTHQPMDPNSRHFTVQRQATIVKVTEQRVMSSPAPSTRSVGTPPASQGLDTVVQRRKATIIKVTEHRESYHPAKVGSAARLPGYRHSYTEGVYQDSNTWDQGNHSQHTAGPSYRHVESTKKPNPSLAPNPATSDPEKNGGTLHRSTLSLFVSSPPAIASPAPSEISPKAVGQRSGRPRRPLSCYGNVFGHTEPSRENVTQPPARKLSFGLPQETGTNPVNHNSCFISPGMAAREAGQLVAHTFTPKRSEDERVAAPEAASKTASPCLTLIQAPDPHSHQSPEEVLALNAAAVIANIKLQRQLSKKKTPNGIPAKDSAPSLQGNTETSMKTHPDRSPVQRHNTPQAAVVPLSVDHETSRRAVSLQEALQRSRPDFIRRSQGRLHELERRSQERKKRAGSVNSRSGVANRQRSAHSVQSTSVKDNPVKPRDRVITGKETHLGSKRRFAEVKRKKDEEKNREVCLTNRQRVELFKKKLLDQILQRNNS